MNEFELSVTIDRPVEDVWAFMQDYSRYPEWTPGLAEARPMSDGPMDVGGELMFTGKFLGRSYENQAECTAFERNSRWVTRTKSGPFYIEYDTRFEPVDGGTRVTTTYRGESRGFFKLAEPAMVRVFRKQCEAANENMKALLEAETTT